MTIWVHQSQAADPHGPPTGIARVEQRIGHALREALGPARVRYCRFDRRRGAFVECPARTPRRRSDVLDSRPVLGERAIGKREALGMIARGLRELMPGPVRTLARGFGSPFLRSAAGGGAALGSEVEPGPAGAQPFVLPGEGAADRAPGMGAESAGAGFRQRRVGPQCLEPGDVLVTLGLEWETGCMPALAAIKQEAGIRILGCCHDLIPIRYPQFCPRYVADLFPTYLAQLAQACDAIACVSECSRRDLEAVLASLSLPVPELFGIRLGSDLPGAGSPVPPASAPLARLLERPYVLCVATIERRKNHEVLYRAFHRLAERYDAGELPRMVFVGARGWGVGDLCSDLALDPTTRGLVLLLHSIGDQDLRLLYRHALFFVFPSLYEGWGLPVAEALGFGKPVICSDRGALPEVGGALVDYVDPWDLPGWESAIERLWRDQAYRQARVEQVAREFRPHPWSETAAAIARAAVRLEGRRPQPGDRAAGARAGGGVDTRSA